VVDYSIFNTHDDHHAGLLRLNTEIISGRIPDILDVSHLPFEIFAARGLLEDLNPFLDADPELCRSELMDSVLRATQIDGALYRVSPTFSVSTIIGNPAFVGNSAGWNLSEFREVLEANPQADIPMGTDASRESFLQMMFLHNVEQFVNWESGTTDFDNGYFIDILQLANTFPAEQDTYVANLIERIENTASKRQIMINRNLCAFAIQEDRAMLGGDFVFKGFPTENRDGSRFSVTGGVAITGGCKDKEGAWEFVRLLLTEGFQRELILGGHSPINRVIFEENKTYTMTHRVIVKSRHDQSSYIDADEVSQEEADMIMAFLESITKALDHDEILWNIISESASDYFKGHITAQEAARIIQSRASRYMSELS
jgi:ABC-type glycerol-3-phosphate transport system substrate-binding protein